MTDLANLADLEDLEDLEDLVPVPDGSRRFWFCPVPDFQFGFCLSSLMVPMVPMVPMAPMVFETLLNRYFEDRIRILCI